MDLVIQITVNILEYGPHDVHGILPKSGEKGLVWLLCDGDADHAAGLASISQSRGGIRTNFMS